MACHLPLVTKGRLNSMHRTRRGGSPSRPSAYGRLRGRVDGDIDPYRAHRKSAPPCRGGYQPPAIRTAPVGRHALMPPPPPGRLRGTGRTEKLHRTCRGGLNIRPYRRRVVGKPTGNRRCPRAHIQCAPTPTLPNLPQGRLTWPPAHPTMYSVLCCRTPPIMDLEKNLKKSEKRC